MASAILVGRPGSPGLGTGRLLAVRPAEVEGPTPAGGAPASPSSERDRLAAALEAAAAELEQLAARLSERAGEEIGAIFEAQALFARDPGIVDPALALVADGCAAHEAILRATDEQAQRLASVDDEYFRERAADVRDLGRRVASHVRGEAPPDLWRLDGHPAIIVARDLDPSTVATLRAELVGGIALADGAPTGHAVIVARALGIPLVLGLGPAIDALVEDVDGAVDGSGGRLLIAPAPEELAALRAPADVGGRVGSAASGASSPGAGPRVGVVANVASAREAEAAAAAGADGIGLVRTELVFLGRHAPPTVAEQRAAYRGIQAAMGGRPVVFRTLDVGGDKPAAWQPANEANPALGVRGLRLGLRRSALLDDQLTALLEATAGAELRLMLPMVSTREELDAARERLDDVHRALVQRGRPVPARIQVGVMIEVPSAAIMADALAPAADFFSIGTNDLVQYTLAADRTNPDLVDLATAFQPSVLRLIDGVVRAARAAGGHVAVCGEAAADPALIPLLVGLGVDQLSVTPSAIRTVRARLAELDAETCRGLATRALAASTAAVARSIAGEASAPRGSSAGAVDPLAVGSGTG
ncbi:MAG TPA: phosphoenolpyruvate--protein phosphotransferase [Candidatus Limnocylindrales bacterium]|nr:phosphoenolpyruvate--protein phosphotransferase [Candidatus Limnocylindrales bacterium]